MQDGDCIKGGSLKSQAIQGNKVICFIWFRFFTRYGFTTFLHPVPGLFGPTWQTLDFFVCACVFLSKKNKNMWLRLICNFSLWL